jgi:hypothetical protein
MSFTQTQLKGTVVLNSDAGANLTIGNTTATNAIIGTTNINATGGGTTTIGTADSGTTNIKGLAINIGDNSPVNINTATATNNSRNTNIGKTTGSFDTNTFIEGKTTVYKLSTDNITSTFAGNNIVIGANNTTTGGIKLGNSAITTNAHNIYGSLGISSTTTSTGLLTANGGLTAVGATNINTTGSSDTTIGHTNNTTTNIVGPINLNGVGSNNTSLITIGNDSTGGITTLASDTINIGNIDTSTTMNATNIKQKIKLTEGSIIENVVGNTTVASSMSTTFNRKSTSSLVALPCYTIACRTIEQYTTQYFELIVSGANNFRGSYTFKCYFAIEKFGLANPTITAVTTVLYYGTGGVAPTISFTTTQTTVTLIVHTTPFSGSTDQNFITTLITYPTCTIVGIISPPPLEDFIITAI